MEDLFDQLQGLSVFFKILGQVFTVFIDYILVYSKKNEKLEEHLRAVLKRFEDKKFKGFEFWLKEVFSLVT